MEVKGVADWAIQASWWVGGIFATGAIWYYLSVGRHGYVAASLGAACAFAALAIVLHRKKAAEDEVARANRSESTVAPSPPIVRPWRVGIYDYAPLSVWPSNDEAEPTGPLVRLAREVAGALGHSVRFELFNYDGFYTDPAGPPDIIAGMFDTKRRAAKVHFSIPMYEIGLQGICRTGQKGNILQGLREGPLKVAVYSSEVGWEFVMDELPDAVREKRAATLAGGHALHTMTLLLDGTYDVVLMDHLSCKTFLEVSSNRKRFKLAFAQPPHKYHVCLAVRPELQGLLPSINSEILRIRNSSAFLQAERDALRGTDQVIELRGLRNARGA